MKYKTVIWDFNGTLLSDMALSVSAMNTVLKKRALPLIPDLSAFRDVFGFPVEDYYARIGFDFSKEPYQIPADEWVALYSEKMFDCPLTEGAVDALSTLRDAGIAQMILSASEKTRLKKHLEMLSILDYFDEIHGTGDVYAAGKSDLAKMLSKRSELFPAVLIGDTDHDLECAKMIGCDCILFSEGFMSKARLSRLGVPVFESLSEISEEIINNK